MQVSRTDVDMNLREWIVAHGRGAITELHHRSRVAPRTISEAARYGAKGRVIAERISEATGGEVTVASLLGLETGAPTDGGA